MPDEFQTLKKERSIEIIKACNGTRYAKAEMAPGAWDQLQHVHALAEEPAK